MSRFTANQVVADNLHHARVQRQWTQEEAAAKLEPYLVGERWSVKTFSAAERSVDGKRVREFTADEIVAFSQAFDLPIGWFFLPPEDESQITPSEDLAATDRPGLHGSLSREVLLACLFTVTYPFRARLQSLFGKQSRRLRTRLTEDVARFYGSFASAWKPELRELEAAEMDLDRLAVLTEKHAETIRSAERLLNAARTSAFWSDQAGVDEPPRGRKKQ